MSLDNVVRLSIVLQDLQTGVLYFNPLQEAMRQEGIDSQIIVARPPRDGALGEPSIGYLRVRIAPPQLGYDRTISIISPVMTGRIVDSNPNVILCVEYSLATLWGWIAGKKTGAAVIIFQEHRAEVGRIKGLWRRFLRSLADHFLANTDAAYEQLRLQVPERKISRFSFLVPPVFETTEAPIHGLPQDSSVVKFLFTGQLITRKNAQLLVAAAKILSREGLSFVCAIVGSGPEKESLSSDVEQSKLGEQVRLLERVPYEEMGNLYSWCDVFVMPTWEDYRSVSVLEAMAAGKPIISSIGDGNVGDSVVDGRNGFVIDPGSARSLADAMRTFICNPQLIPEMGQRSADYMENLTPENAAKGMRRMIDRGEFGERIWARRR